MAGASENICIGSCHISGAFSHCCDAVVIGYIGLVVHVDPAAGDLTAFTTTSSSQRTEWVSLYGCTSSTNRVILADDKQYTQQANVVFVELELEIVHNNF